MRGKGLLSGLTPIFTALGVNAVPVTGVFFSGWPVETAMVVYFLENLITVAVTTMRIHFLAPAREDVPGQKPQERRSMLQNFLVVALGFSLAVGIFLSFFIFGILKAPVAAADVASGVGWIIVFQLVGLIADLILWRRVSLDLANSFLEQSLGRVFLLYLAVFTGLCAAAYTNEWFVYPFMGLKTMVDVGGQIQFFIRRMRWQPATSAVTSDL